MNEINGFTVQQLQSALEKKELTSREITEACLNRIEAVDDTLKSFLTLDQKGALKQAEEVDRRLSKGEIERGPLTGIPIAIKDNIVTKSVRTTCGSRILENYIPPYDATVIEKLKAAGAVLIGKTNCDEFAMGSSTENSAFQATANPWALDRVPGGSSGGSAAAVGAKLAPLALGTDTGGSIRQPAAFCGVVGLKPTYGRVSRYGLVAFGSSLDQIGPVARSVQDSATLLQGIAGHDRRDSTSSKRAPGNYMSEMGKDVRGLRIGVPAEWFDAGLDSEVRSLVQAAVNKISELGCEIEEVHLPHTEFAIATYYIIAPAEASSNLARYDGVKYGLRNPSPKDLEDMYVGSRTKGFGPEVKRRIMIGTYVLSSGYYDAYYVKASRVRTLIKQDYLKAFEKVDLMVGPTTPSLPFKLGEKLLDPLSMYLSDVYTVTANLAGLPGLSMPCGFSKGGLPVGLQILGPHFEEGRVLCMAHALESELSVTAPDLPL